MITINTQTRNELLRHIERMRAGGGTRPWNALNRAFSNPEGKQLYLMTDGYPSGCWSSSCRPCQVNSYISKNKSKKVPIKVNTINAGPRMSWLEDFSNRGGGDYKFV